MQQTSEICAAHGIGAGCLAFGKAYKTAENFRCLVKIWKKVLRFYTKFCIIMFKEKDKKLQRK
jgi:hypothetical protein